MISKYVSIGLLVLAALLLIPFEQKVAGYIVLGTGALSLLASERWFARHMTVLFLSLAVLGATHIDTSIEPVPFVTMGLLLLVAVGLPYVIFRYVYKEPEIIRYHFEKHSFTKVQIGYILLALIVSYLLLPFWMQSTGGYMNWTVATDPASLVVLFVGTNGLGIWDELFFIVTVLGILRHHLPFWQANIVQAVLFTGFLYELGFQGWAPFAIFPFALSQGLIFKYTQNLLYIIAIHLTIDLVLYLALINAHHPQLLQIFITS